MPTTAPLVTTNGRTVLNATQVANTSGVHDALVRINYRTRTVTMDSLNGFYEDNRVQYLHQEASVELVAAIEGSTWAPNLDAAPGVGSNDRKTSARSAIIPIVNGPRGVNNPERQGLQSALLGQGDPPPEHHAGGPRTTRTTHRSGTSHQPFGPAPPSAPESASGWKTTTTWPTCSRMV